MGKDRKMLSLPNIPSTDLKVSRELFSSESVFGPE